ncbi:MAG: 16S rRNA (cytosine(1402)-N(4))-methyltransferase RsmH [Proteobacteria bacterium]|nr:16S rRNA (cytosine(1402)-N(4))-methyltransferase RsmH [Pseudomonadota bacterium]
MLLCENGNCVTEHIPVFLDEFLKFCPKMTHGSYLDLTLGAGGHLRALLENQKNWNAVARDRDPRAIERVQNSFSSELMSRISLVQGNFSEEEKSQLSFDYIFADLGVSSFQFDPELSGMSLNSELVLDFRMNPDEGDNFLTWLKKQNPRILEDIFYGFGEEPKARKLAEAVWSADADVFKNAKSFSSFIARVLAYKDSKRHPATRIFQALRMAINQEVESLSSLLNWAPKRLKVGGRMGVISFHSLEDRLVKKKWLSLESGGDFVILTKRPQSPSEGELVANPRARSAKLRVIERVG